MAPFALRDAHACDFPRILVLNDGEVAQTSAMDGARLQSLAALADYHRVAVVDGAVVAFLLAMRAGAAYANDNFGWFAARLPDFVYVDRIVVDAACAGRGIGGALYRDLFAWARVRAIPRVTCEYNVVPPNPASRAFHDRFGFRELGQQNVAGGTKRVSLQVATPRIGAVRSPRDVGARGRRGGRLGVACAGAGVDVGLEVAPGAGLGGTGDDPAWILNAAEPIIFPNPTAGSGAGGVRDP